MEAHPKTQDSNPQPNGNPNLKFSTLIPDCASLLATSQHIMAYHSIPYHSLPCHLISYRIIQGQKSTKSYHIKVNINPETSFSDQRRSITSPRCPCQKSSESCTGPERLRPQDAMATHYLICTCMAASIISISRLAVARNLKILVRTTLSSTKQSASHS